MRRVMRAATALLVVLLGTLAPGAVPSASAADLVQYGWWTVTTPDPSLGLPPVSAVSQPDVPAGGLVVEGPEQKPISFGAVLFRLQPGERAQRLTLDVAASSASTSVDVLELCRLSSTFEPVQGGSSADAPTYDCSKPVAGSYDAAGTAWIFTLPTTSGPTGAWAIVCHGGDRVVLNGPTADSLQTVLGPRIGLDGGPTPAPDVTPPPVTTPQPGEPELAPIPQPALSAAPTPAMAAAPTTVAAAVTRPQPVSFPTELSAVQRAAQVLVLVAVLLLLRQTLLTNRAAT